MTAPDVEGCCVCGRTALPHPDTSVARQLGHPVPAREAVTWRCSACRRLVCRECVYVILVEIDGVMLEEIPHETLCTEKGCVAARKANPDP